MMSKEKKTPDPEKRFKGLPIRVDRIDGIEWMLVRSVSYQTQASTTSTVRKGFVFDFASVPRVFYCIYPPAGNGKDHYGVAATFHDWLYVHRKIEGKKVSRIEADDLFLEIMLYVGVRAFTAKTMYRAVRMFGWIPWNKRKPEDIIP